MKYGKINGLVLVVLCLSSLSVQARQEVKTEVIESTVFDRFVSLGGTVVPHKKVTINAQQPGQINYISGIEGDKFTTGTLLISTDDDVLRAKRAAAMAQWQQASYAYENSQTQYNREVWSPATEKSMSGMAMPGLMDQMFTRPMSNSMGYGDTDVDRRANVLNAQANVQKAAAQMRLIKAQIDEIDVRLSDTKSVAPFTGVIVEKLVEEGDTVQPGQSLLVFAKSNHLSLEVNVPVTLMLGIKKGAVYKAKFGSDRDIDVRVAQIFPVADPKQHTVKIKLDLPVGSAAAPGMYATVSILNSSSRGQSFPAVPVGAVVKRGSLPVVFVVNAKTQEVEMKIVRLGKALPNGKRVVLSGVNNGEKIITNPPSNIVSGWILNNGKLSAPKNNDDA